MLDYETHDAKFKVVCGHLHLVSHVFLFFVLFFVLMCMQMRLVWKQHKTARSAWREGKPY